jgi:hypothetical protein
MKKVLKSIFLVAFVALLLGSCSSTLSTINQPDSPVEFKATDFKFSDRVSIEVTINKGYLGFFGDNEYKNTQGEIVKAGSADGLLGMIPIIGDVASDKDKGFAIYEMLKKYPGYDVILYPSYTIKSEGVFPCTKTIKMSAKLGKLK